MRPYRVDSGRELIVVLVTGGLGIYFLTPSSPVGHAGRVGGHQLACLVELRVVMVPVSARLPAMPSSQGRQAQPAAWH